MTLAEPKINFLSVAKGFGVAARRIENPEDIGPALSEALDSGRPWLLDVLVDDNT